MRGFLLGLVLIVGASAAVLGLRPGGLRRQLSLAARRFRIFLALGGMYLLASGAIRLLFSSGPVADYGPAALAVLLTAIFIVVARDPAPGGTQPRTGA